MTMLTFPRLVSFGVVFPLADVQAVTLAGEACIIPAEGVNAEKWSNGTIFAKVEFAEAWRNGVRRLRADSVQYRPDHTY